MQKGSIVKSRRKSGTEVWEFRWRDRTLSPVIYRRIVLGTTKEFLDAVSAGTSASGIVLEINRRDPRIKTQALAVKELVAHYRHCELVPDNAWKTHSTKRAYENYLQRWILPKWGEYRLNQIKPIEVELDVLDVDGSDDLYPGGNEFFRVLPASCVAGARGIVIGQAIDKTSLGAPPNERLHIYGCSLSEVL
jgi:hypothetical protein